MACGGLENRGKKVQGVGMGFLLCGTSSSSSSNRYVVVVVVVLVSRNDVCEECLAGG